MKLLEVELDLKNPITLLRAIDKFIARKVIIEDSENGRIEGIIVARKGRKTYIFRSYPNKKTVQDTELDYRNLRGMQLINPREEDYRRARVSYQEVTQETIAETLKWANRVRT